MNRYTVITGPVGFPVTLEEVKADLKITSTASDSVLEDLIAVATDELEAYTRRYFIEREMLGEYDSINSTKLERYPFAKIERSPLKNIDSVQVSRSNVFVDQTYQLKDQSTFARILFNDGISCLDDIPFPLKISFFAGYGDADAVPVRIKSAIRRLVVYLFQNPGYCDDGCTAENLPGDVRMLIASFRIVDGFGVHS